jgi:hypothetical protein
VRACNLCVKRSVRHLLQCTPSAAPLAPTAILIAHMHRVGQNHTFIGIYGVHTAFLAGKSPYIRSYTVQIYGSDQSYTYHIQHKQASTGRTNETLHLKSHTHIHTQITHIVAHTHTHTHTLTHTRTHTRTHTCTHIHTYTHTHTDHSPCRPWCCPEMAGSCWSEACGARCQVCEFVNV